MKIILQILVAAGAMAFLAGCTSGKKLVTVLVEDKNGNVELVYAKTQSAENLVREIRYYPNGDTLSVTPMLKGSVHGIVVSYHPNNRPKEQVTFVNGDQNGVFRRFDTDGVIVFEGNLVDGKKNGVWTTWYDEVQMQEQRYYTDDLPDGKWTYWYIDGSVKREEVYEAGKLIAESDY